MMQEFWVVGGRYRDTTFTSLDSPPEVFGPFAGYEEALRSWVDRSERTRSFAAVRYSIVTAAPSRARGG